MTRRITRRAILAIVGVCAVLLVGLAASGCARTTRVGEPGVPEAGASQTVTPAPSGGIPKDSAIAIARQHVPADAVLVSAEAGAFATEVDSAKIGPGYPVAPDRLVWAVKYESDFTICPPDGSACWSPRPGWTTVILDFMTGDFLAAPAIAPS